MKKKFPLIVDLDGTITKYDTTLILIIKLLFTKTYLIVILFFYLLKGKAFLKHKISYFIQIDAKSLTYNKNLIKYLKKEKKNGRKIVLCTGSNLKTANSISKYLNLFSKVYASNESLNLKGENKAIKLVKIFGFKKFDYVGNSFDDLAVWKNSNNAIVVNASKNLIKKVKKISNSVIIFR